MNDNEETFEGVGEPASQKTVGERPVSQQDIKDLHQRNKKEREALESLKARGDFDQN